MTPCSTSARNDTAHLFEPGGRGGVYQHTVEVARLLTADGSRVVMHTASDHELHDVDVEFCLCFDWFRDSTTGRRQKVAAHFLLRVVPHLARTRGRVTWIQGGFKPLLTLILILVLRTFRHTVLFSPHNIFVRDGSRRSHRILEECMRSASCVVVYNSADERTLHHKGLRVERAPLVMYAPRIPPHVLSRWRAVIDANHIRVCSVGQLRNDKNLDMLVKSCQQAGLGLLIAGADLGAADAIRDAIDQRSRSRVVLFVEYLELEDLAAIVSTAGLVALPYSISSQSAVAELAIAYGTPVVAYDTGGLAERADYVVADLSVETWARELLRATDDSSTPEPAPIVISQPHDLSALRALLRVGR